MINNYNLLKLEKSLEDISGRVIFKRGCDYYESKFVESIEIFDYGNEEIEASGIVTGTSDYTASVFFNIKSSEIVDGHCTCPYDNFCKHSVAIGLLFIEKYNHFLEKNEWRGVDNFKKKFISWIEFNQANNEVNENNDNLSKEEIVNKISYLVGLGKGHQEEINELLRLMMAKIDSKEVVKKKPKKLKKLNLDKYHILVEVSYYGLSIQLRGNGNSSLSVDYESLLANYGLSEKEIELINLLNIGHGWNDKGLEYKKIFELIKELSLKIYNKRKHHKNVIFLDFEPIKIKANLCRSNKEDVLNDITKPIFIFALPHLGKANVDYYFSESGLVVVSKNKIEIHVMSRALIKILKRIGALTNIYYKRDADNKYSTELLEVEVINLNKIIKDIRKSFELESEIEANFKIVKHKKTTPCFLVNYSFDDSFLDIRAMMRYGAIESDITDSHHFSQSNYSGGFRRRYEYDEDKYYIEIDKDSINYARIDKKGELALCNEVYGRNVGFSRQLKCVKKGNKQIFEYSQVFLPALINVGHEVIYTQDRLSFKEAEFKADFDVDLNSENDWLAFDIKCYCGEDGINLEDLKNYVKEKKDFLKTDDGRLLKVSNVDELKKLILMLESFNAKENNKYEGKLYHAPELNDVFTSSKYYNAKFKNSFKEFINEAKSGKPVERVKLPSKSKKILRNYQQDGINWFYFLRKYRFAGILADDMGLGKTLQTLTLLNLNKVENKPSIVICPKTLLYNWQEEVVKFTSGLKTIVVDGPQVQRLNEIQKINSKNNKIKPDLIITSYPALQKDSETYENENIKFNYCVLDEAQSIKNHKTKNARTVKKINADYRLALTGTPLENNVSEIWSTFDFLMPGFLGNNKQFKEKFEKPIMKQSDLQALAALKRKTEVFMLRRTKDKVLTELPSKIEQVSHCQLENAQNILYQEVLSKVKNDIFKTVEEKGFNKSQIHILAGLTKLRQVCNHPVLLLKDRDYKKYESAKLNIFLELITEMNASKQKVLVFSQFTKMLNILASELDESGINYSYLSGKTKNRQELVNEFNKDKNKQVFLISLKAGGVGLNLTSAENVIIFDPWWNPSAENQAIDRAHRIGQEKSVNVYRLITKGTIEERIVALQEKKKFLFDNLIGESNDLFKKLTWDDVKDIFK